MDESDWPRLALACLILFEGVQTPFEQLLAPELLSDSLRQFANDLTRGARSQRARAMALELAPVAKTLESWSLE